MLIMKSRLFVIAGAIAITAVCCVACFADSDSTHSSFLPPIRYRNIPLYSFTLDSANYTNENDRIVYHLLRFDSEELDSGYEVIGSVAPSYPPNFCSEDALLCVDLAGEGRHRHRRGAGCTGGIGEDHRTVDARGQRSLW